MQPISPNYNWENVVKQIKITEEIFLQSCIYVQSCISIAKDKDHGIRVKVQQTFFFNFTPICLISAEWVWFI